MFFLSPTTVALMDFTTLAIAALVSTSASSRFMFAAALFIAFSVNSASIPRI
jgi:hypothetical protein